MKHHDPIDLIRQQNPVPDAHQLPDGPNTASAEALFQEIIGMTPTQTTTTPKRSRRVAVLAAALLALGATAAAATVFREGNLPEPAFAGETWELVVGEGANDEAGTVYKVCHRFSDPSQPSETSGLGTSGCEVVSLGASTDTVFVDVQSAVKTPTGTVLFVNLTTEPVAAVAVVLDDGSTSTVTPLRMPQSGKQFAAIEIPDGSTQGVTVQALDADNQLIESRLVADLTPAG